MLRKIDALIGKVMFQPPIILCCQLIGWTQYQFSRAFVVFAVLVNGVFAYEASVWVFLLINLFLAVVAMLRFTVMSPQTPEPESVFMRLFDWAGLIGMFLLFLGKSIFIYAIGYFFLYLISQYAATITTIPPRETRTKLIPARQS